MIAVVVLARMIAVRLDVYVQQDVWEVIAKVGLLTFYSNENHFMFFFFKEDICTMYPCANNGQCVPEGNSRRCICSSPYSGDDCREGKQKKKNYSNKRLIITLI